MVAFKRMIYFVMKQPQCSINIWFGGFVSVFNIFIEEQFLFSIIFNDIYEWSFPSLTTDSKLYLHLDFD